MPARTTPDLALTGLIALATYRFTRLVILDAISEPVRERLFNRWPPTLVRAGQRWTGQRLVDRSEHSPRPKPSWLGKLLDCPWCTSVWLAALITFATALFVPVPLPVLTFTAAATAAGFLGTLDRALG